MIALLGSSDANGWRFAVGDPTLLGWITVGAYVFASWQCMLAALREPELSGGKRTRPSPFWLLLALLLLGLGINKQLDLQTLVTDIGRNVLKSTGLYERRRIYQIVFVNAVACAAAALALAFIWTCRSRFYRRRFAALGTCFLFGFAVIRAASFHRVNSIMGAKLGSFSWSPVFELGGISLIALGAMSVVDSSQSPRKIFSQRDPAIASASSASAVLANSAIDSSDNRVMTRAARTSRHENRVGR